MLLLCVPPAALFGHQVLHSVSKLSIVPAQGGRRCTRPHPIAFDMSYPIHEVLVLSRKARDLVLTVDGYLNLLLFFHAQIRHFLLVLSLSSREVVQLNCQLIALPFHLKVLFREKVSISRCQVQ
ncbi:hypothetical protein H310_06787 [Aphanomyces invadans]|uniref:Uncharacterized protein n=1 Tax=Aphanomyces invadans TaxID=157072 RepID=A0A024U4L7_9STRA|nr:hypothetical protein H310_06787 [Aphanomyces invadans]ETW01194.1 hypothetical protein H310_06787 [Aphanomyces invadans]|eukprot:XP_008870192.1 hypothetical protein H310_06787 [Aphanomyces invadans]